MTTKHTQGEWNVNTIYKNPFSIDTLYIINKGEAQSLKESEANAKLIAATPALLNAAILCESISDKCNNAMLPTHIQDLLQSINTTLKTAISKATN